MSMNVVAEHIREALESADLEAVRQLLDPDAYWGPPDDDESGCHNRDEIIAFWQRGRDAGVRAIVRELVVGEDKVLVGLQLTGNDAPSEEAGEADRWQVMTIRRDKVIDIRGYDERQEAAQHAGVS
jgi:hypothetical protein